MPTLATAATGTIVKIATVTIPELRNATDIGMAFAMVDVSAHDGDGWSSNIPTLKRGKPITLEINYVPANAAHQALFTAAQTRASTAFTVTLPTTGNPHGPFRPSSVTSAFPLSGGWRVTVACHHYARWRDDICVNHNYLSFV